MRADPLMHEATRLHKAGRIADAAGVYQRILRDNPQHFEALYGLGMAHAQEGRLNEGQQLLDEALKISPDFAEGWRARALMLLHLGRGEEARANLDKALALKPDFQEALAVRASLTAQMAQPQEALLILERQLAVNPNDADLWNSRGSLLVSVGERDHARASFDRALAIRPDFVEALCNRATLLFETGRHGEALAGFDAALALEPDSAIALNNRGNVLTRMGFFEEALASYDRALEILPDFPEAKENRELPLFELGRTSRSPAKYMRGLFDGFSNHYDETMLRKLDYRGHLHVRALADRVLPKRAASWRILDLGCGTGLVGLAFKDMAEAGRLDGIDIAPRMIEAARKRGLYDLLIVGDIETELMESGVSYDLIVSADTMTYFGDLARVLDGVARRLESGGFYLFASEAKIGEGWEKTKVHRFRHSESYLRGQASQAGFDVVEISGCTLRLEENEPVHGFAVALRKPGAGKH